jgi:ABC-type Zn uptake system ZnuABC Zn-binding protein ZnuA
MTRLEQLIEERNKIVAESSKYTDKLKAIDKLVGFKIQDDSGMTVCSLDFDFSYHKGVMFQVNCYGVWLEHTEIRALAEHIMRLTDEVKEENKQ